MERVGEGGGGGGGDDRKVELIVFRCIHWAPASTLILVQTADIDPGNNALLPSVFLALHSVWIQEVPRVQISRAVRRGDRGFRSRSTRLPFERTICQQFLLTLILLS